ncbi:phage tail protein [Streptomyces hydrogenans]|uniref:phage tail protein n=1 Tax=Streptomyces hydrogenans TaxID=1873719 RepID=UPI0037FC361B
MANNEAEVDIVVSAAGALPDLERQLQRIVNSAQSTAPEVGLEAGLNARNTLRTLDTALGRVVSAAEADPNNQIDLTAVLDQRQSIRELDASIGRAVAAVQAGAPEVTVEARLERGTLASLRTGIDAVVATLNRTTDPVEVEVEVDRDWEGRVNRLGSSLLRLGRSAGSAVGTVAPLVGRIGALGGVLGAAVPAAAALAAAVQQIAPAAAVATSGMLTMRLTAATLKLALVGVEDAITDAFDPEISPDEFHKSLEKLAPEAAKFADELHTMRRELKAVQQGVQNRVFKDFDQLLRGLAQRVGPQVTRSLNRTADSLNRMGKNAAIAGAQIAERGVLGQALNGATKSLENLEEVPARAITGFSLLAAASAPAMNRITAAVNSASVRIAERLDAAFESGELERLIDRAVDTFAQLGRIVGNFASGVGNLFGGLTQDGGGLFDTLEKLSGAFEDLTASEEFQSVLKELALTVGTLVEALLPLFTQALQILAPAIELIAPAFRDFIEEIVPHLMLFLQRSAPLVNELAELLAGALPYAAKIAGGALDFLGIVFGGLAIIIDRSERALHFFQDRFGPLKRVVDEFIVDVVTKTPKVGDSIESMTAESGSSLVKFGDNLVVKTLSKVNQFVVGVQQSTAKVVKYMYDLALGIRDAINGFIGEFFRIGQDLIGGLISGIRSMVPDVLGLAASLANSVVSTIKGALDIQSPSRVMMSIGKDTGRGFIIGLENMLPDVRKQVNNLAHAAQLKAPSGFGAAGAIGITPLGPSGGPTPVNVYLGNELIGSYVDGRVATANTRRRRTYVQGFRY